jgi:AcrR family transcriptional regulator
MLSVMTTETVPLDRRQRRRLETIEEVLDHAAAIMIEDGVAGLSLGEIARRMGIRPPSLYVYFPSKNALYDALFARGVTALLAQMRDLLETSPPPGDDLVEVMLRFARSFVEWGVTHPAYAQLFHWRPVPGFEPSAEAYAPSVELYQLGRERFVDLQQRGLIRADADIDEVQRDWTILVTGVVTQQLSNAPEESFENGRYVAALPRVAAMFAAYYGASSPATHVATQPSRRGHARKR